MAAGTGATAAGGAQVSGALADLDELRTALASLVAQLQSVPPQVEDAGALAEIAVSAQREARKSKPDKRILSGLLQALMAGVTTSATLANAVLAIQHAVSILL
jgi:cytochrome P450